MLKNTAFLYLHTLYTLSLKHWGPKREKNEKIFLWIESLRLEFLKLGHLRHVGILRLNAILWFEVGVVFFAFHDHTGHAHAKPRPDLAHLVLKVSKSQKHFMVSSILPKNERNSLSWTSVEDAQDSEFRSFFGRNEDTKNCFWDLMTCSDLGYPLVLIFFAFISFFLIFSKTRILFKVFVLLGL